jgi:hypothetical protein
VGFVHLEPEVRIGGVDPFLPSQHGWKNQERKQAQEETSLGEGRESFRHRDSLLKR